MSQVKNVVLVNCGGTEDIMKLLDNPKDVVIYILDSHRPTHILNIYDDSQQVSNYLGGMIFLFCNLYLSTRTLLYSEILDSTRYSSR